MEETVSGVRSEGKWKDVVRDGERVTDALRSTIDEEEAEDWEEWRPREEEELKDHVRERTVEKATVSRNEVEKGGKTAVDQAEKAVEDVGRAVADIGHGEVDKAAEDGSRALRELWRSIDTAVRKAFRGIEAFVYHHIMSRTNPQYFHSELVSASLDEKSRVKNSRRDPEEREYVMAISINDDRVKRFKEEIRKKESV